MILLIDNYDSFTYNLYHLIGELHRDIKVVRNDKITIDEIRKLNPDVIVLSPGPKAPKDAGICLEVVKKLYKEYPILGICLGHQTIGEAFGGDVVIANKAVHGKVSYIKHTGKSIFKGLEQDVQIARYHSLIVEKDSMPEILEILAETDEGEVMAVKHKNYPVVGLQFHPESINTPKGKEMMKNFLEEVM
ncbi:anthranilate synthase component II [Ilyobacter polytropus]|uniref:Anthranilate synthase, component II n=1 Tax=Ilyobacter polytropus (strain ATCC 51220 / DSM 2926 / LMG 16218 / CuHBu1) TaxID=572544 RepID=E3HDI6_ILYPC|nr:aminodeoxychorismate/anthranilate synthase component II [Ilyobacter polytropus]ADO84172.1 anthranilate synthase, component II [Ilyobacter polytropus DSM 2926]